MRGLMAATASSAAAALLHAAPPAAAAEVTVPLSEAVASLSVAVEDRTGYDRDTSYGDWIDADRDGCNTRAEVLLEEAVEAPQRSGRCALSGGRWYSWYDDVYVDGKGGLDIDHMVPLAESWDSGAKGWTQERRVRYANYLKDPRHLVAVTARSNRQKSDQDPAEWLPIDSVRCRYVADWTSIKLSWSLSVDTGEKEKLTELASGCPDLPVTYEPVE